MLNKDDEGVRFGDLNGGFISTDSNDNVIIGINSSPKLVVGNNGIIYDDMMKVPISTNDGTNYIMSYGFNNTDNYTGFGYFADLTDKYLLMQVGQSDFNSYFSKSESFIDSDNLLLNGSLEFGSAIMNYDTALNFKISNNTKLSIDSTKLTSTVPLSLPLGSTTTPALYFNTNSKTGIYSSAINNLDFTINEITNLNINANSIAVNKPLLLQIGTSANPSIGFIGDENTGIYSDSAGTLKFSSDGDLIISIAYHEDSANDATIFYRNLVPNALNSCDIGTSNFRFNKFYSKILSDNGTNVNISSLNINQAIVTDGSKNLVSMQYTNSATSSTIVSRDASGNSSFNSLNIASLTASQAIVTDASKNLVSMQYTDTATANTIVSRDSSGNSIFNSINLSGLTAYTTTSSEGTALIVQDGQVKTITMTSNNANYSLVCRSTGGNVTLGTIDCAFVRGRVNDVFTCGTASYKWAGLYSRNITDDGSQIIINSHCLPDADGTRDLGSASKQWRNIYSVNALTVSDQNLKKDIITNSVNYYDIIDNIRVVKYNWISNLESNSENPTEIGVIAQELELVIPQLVKTEDKIDIVQNYDEEGNKLEPTIINNGTRKFVNYNQFIPILINCIQTLKTKCENYESRLSALENK